MKFLILFIALLISFSASSQVELIEKKGRKYWYKGKFYKRNNLGTIYSQSPEAYKLFKSGKKKLKRAKIFGFISLGLIGSGTILILSDDFVAAAFGGAAVVAGTISGLIAITPAIRGNRKMKKALNAYNYDMLERHGYNEDTSLSIGVTGNGIGIVYSF